jgi:hypothetical protein
MAVMVFWRWGWSVPHLFRFGADLLRICLALWQLVYFLDRRGAVTIHAQVRACCTMRAQSHVFQGHTGFIGDMVRYLRSIDDRGGESVLFN